MFSHKNEKTKGIKIPFGKSRILTEGSWAYTCGKKRGKRKKRGGEKEGIAEVAQRVFCQTIAN
jgi:hypothetical protein